MIFSHEIPTDRVTIWLLTLEPSKSERGPTSHNYSRATSVNRPAPAKQDVQAESNSQRAGSISPLFSVQRGAYWKVVIVVVVVFNTINKKKKSRCFPKGRWSASVGKMCVSCHSLSFSHPVDCQRFPHIHVAPPSKSSSSPLFKLFRQGVNKTSHSEHILFAKAFAF